MSVDDICNLGVSRVAADDSVLLMWVTDPYLLDALRLWNLGTSLIKR